LFYSMGNLVNSNSRPKHFLLVTNFIIAWGLHLFLNSSSYEGQEDFI